MSKIMTCRLSKKSNNRGAVKRAGAGGIVGFDLQDNGDLTFTVFGTDAAGALVDISDVATLTATSSDSTVVTVDPPVKMSSAVHAAVPPPVVGATASISFTATWNDGSVGPFTIDWPQTIVAGPVTGIAVQPGTPSVH